MPSVHISKKMCLVQTAGTNLCTASAFDVNGATQVCPDCFNFPGNNISCPSNSAFCCSSYGPSAGACVPSPSDCACSDSSECPGGFCCDGGSVCFLHRMHVHSSGHGPVFRLRARWLLDDGAFRCCMSGPAGTSQCTASPFVNGTQVCGDCNNFNGGAACPANASFCCGRPSGDCVSEVSQCPCASTYDCPSGSCCDLGEWSALLNPMHTFPCTLHHALDMTIGRSLLARM